MLATTLLVNGQQAQFDPMMGRLLNLYVQINTENDTPIIHLGDDLPKEVVLASDNTNMVIASIYDIGSHRDMCMDYTLTTPRFNCQITGGGS